MRRIMVVAAVLFIAAMAAGCKKESSPPIVPQSLPAEGGIQFTDEIKTMEKVLEKNPDDLSALVQLGNLSMDSRDFQKAVDAYERALKLDPKNVNVRVDMGTCYRNLGKADVALKEYRKAMEINPNHAYAHLNAGVVLFDDMKKYDEAIVELEKFLELDPANPRAPEIRDLINQLKQQK